MIVTFKPKEQRPDQADKVEIVTRSLSSRVRMLDVATFTTGSSSVPTGLAWPELGFDTNLHQAPIVCLWLDEPEVAGLRNDPNVLRVEEDGPIYALPDSLAFESQPPPEAETVPNGVQQVKAPAAWGCSRGRGIKVALLDSGIDSTHPDLEPNFKGGISLVPGETLMDRDGHGTHCAGVVAAAMNGVGVVGVAPEASLYAVKVLSDNQSGNWGWLINGLYWCIQNGINIVSMSLAGIDAPIAVEETCDAAFGAGLLLVAGAGNSGPNPDSVTQPARYRNVIAVSSIDADNVIAPLSSRGPEVELSAPGVKVLSTLPGGRFGRKTGTSMACPHVAGGAAVVWGAHRFATNVQIWDLLASTADNLGPPGWDPLYGYGRLDVDQAALAMTPAPAMPFKP